MAWLILRAGTGKCLSPCLARKPLKVSPVIPNPSGNLETYDAMFISIHPATRPCPAAHGTHADEKPKRRIRASV